MVGRAPSTNPPRLAPNLAFEVACDAGCPLGARPAQNSTGATATARAPAPQSARVPLTVHAAAAANSALGARRLQGWVFCYGDLLQIRPLGEL